MIKSSADPAVPSLKSRCWLQHLLLLIFCRQERVLPYSLQSGVVETRTRPDTFEGWEAGIPWLQRVRRETGLKVIVEVATPAHLEAVLKAGIDMIWVGAALRPILCSTGIGRCSQGVDISVFVKTPQSDLDLWLGAVERIEMAGIQDISVIHRGFSFYEKGRYRNEPKWQVPIDLMR